MKRAHRMALLGTSLLVTAALASGCSRGPGDVYVDMTTAAQMGDREGFLTGFTTASRPLVEALIGLSEAYGMRNSNPYELLVFDSIDDEVVEGDRAVLTVRTGAKTRRILMIEEEGDWRIDTAALEKFWGGGGAQ